MFDEYYIGRGPSHTATTVNEHRAPTDDSVRLLAEMEEKIRSKLVGSFATSNNTLQATWAEQHDPMTCDHQFYCKFVLNGKTHEVRVNLSIEDDSDAKARKLYEKLCGVLAGELMAPLLKEMRGKL